MVLKECVIMNVRSIETDYNLDTKFGTPLGKDQANNKMGVISSLSKALMSYLSLLAQAK